jgi:hypothetical protein
MTESVWLAYLEDELASASEPAAQRFATACCRRTWHFMDDPRHRAAVKAAERLADGRAAAAEFESASAPVVALWADLPPGYQRWQPWQHLTGATRHLGGWPHGRRCSQLGPWRVAQVGTAARAGSRRGWRRLRRNASCSPPSKVMPNQMLHLAQAGSSQDG